MYKIRLVAKIGILFVTKKKHLLNSTGARQPFNKPNLFTKTKSVNNRFVINDKINPKKVAPADKNNL